MMAHKWAVLITTYAGMVVLLFAFSGCGKKTPEEKEKARAKKWAAKELKVAQKKVLGQAETGPVAMPPLPGVGELGLQVSSVQGDVQMATSEMPQYFQSVLPGMRIPPDSKINTRPASQGDLELIEKELKIRLKENTDAVGGAFAFLKGKKEGRFELRRGTLYIRIEEEYKGTFTVTTPTVEVTAVGTAFCVEVYGGMGDTWVGVVQGETRVVNLLTDEEIELRAGDAVEVSALQEKMELSQLEEDEKEWLKQEIRRIGSGLPEELEPKIELLLPNNKERLEAFLKRTAFATNGKEPRRVHALMMKSLKLMEEGIAEEEKPILLQSIQKLESTLLFYNDPRYAPQLLMFIAAYYRDLREYEKAIAVLERVRGLYPGTPLVTVAVAAMGRIYEEDLKRLEKAEEMYRLILEQFGETLEREEAMNGLDRVRMKLYE